MESVVEVEWVVIYLEMIKAIMTVDEFAVEKVSIKR